jgi:hypothetical protein
MEKLRKLKLEYNLYKYTFEVKHEFEYELYLCKMEQLKKQIEKIEKRHRIG